MSIIKFFISVFLLTIPLSLFAQEDTAYFVSYTHKLTTRFYLSQKYTSLTLHNSSNDVDLRYTPNTTLNMGIGFTYRAATLNLAYGFGFLNPDKDHGKTKYLDLQYHNYGKRLVFDVFGQFYKGFYLASKGQGRLDGQYYIRPDLFVYELGFNLQYVLNNKVLSHRAGILQDEWQKKSAGSFLLGAETYFGHVSGDSTIIPVKVNQKLAALDVRRLNFFQLGPNGGYIYTLVIQKNYFVSASISLSLDYTSNTSYDRQGSKHQRGLSPNTFVRLSTGYNSEVWAVSVVYLNDGVNIATGGPATRATLNTGNIRVNLVRRFALDRRNKAAREMMDFKAF
jgi:hypothetical protein